MQTSQLKKADVYSFASEATWIRCDFGQLWVSHDGEDIVLECGEKRFFSGADRIVLEALQDSRFSHFEEPTVKPFIQKAALQFKHTAVAN